MGVLETLRLLFGFRAPVGRKAYAVSGFALMALKYGGDWALTRAAAEHAIAPTFYLNPIFSLRLCRSAVPSRRTASPRKTTERRSRRLGQGRLVTFATPRG